MLASKRPLSTSIRTLTCNGICLISAHRILIEMVTQHIQNKLAHDSFLIIFYASTSSSFYLGLFRYEKFVFIEFRLNETRNNLMKNSQRYCINAYFFLAHLHYLFAFLLFNMSLYHSGIFIFHTPPRTGCKL